MKVLFRRLEFILFLGLPRGNPIMLCREGVRLNVGTSIWWNPTKLPLVTKRVSLLPREFPCCQESEHCVSSVYIIPTTVWSTFVFRQRSHQSSFSPKMSWVCVPVCICVCLGVCVPVCVCVCVCLPSPAMPQFKPQLARLSWF